MQDSSAKIAMRSSIFKLIGLVGSSSAALTQTEAPARTQSQQHPEKPWNNDYCIESFDVLSALTITPYEDCVNCYLAHFKDDGIIVTAPENLFKDEHFQVSVFLSEEVLIKRPPGPTGNVIANTWSHQNYPQYIGYMKINHWWWATSPKVEGTLDAKIWFQLKGDTFPEFLYADLCMTPPWESSTYQSTTTDGDTTTTKKITTPVPTSPPLSAETCEGVVDYKMRNGKVKIIRSGEKSKTLRLTQQKVKETKKYTGFVSFPKATCGKDFLTALQDGRVQIDFSDKKAAYIQPFDPYYIDNGPSTQVVVQYESSPLNVADDKCPKCLGSSSADELEMIIFGLNNVEFGNKKISTCLNSIQVGHAGSAGNPVSLGLEDNSGCVAWTNDL